MMISPNLSTKTYALVLVIISVIVISGVQTVDGFTSISVNLEYKIQPGETQMLTWGIINDDDIPLNLEMYATGQGAELFVFEENVIIEPGAVRDIEIFVVVPEDYPTDLELRPQVYAKKISPVEVHTEGATINMIIQHVTNPKILIGDNPVYYAPEIIEEIIPDIATNDDTPKPPTPEVESIPGETMQEKLDRIKAANLVDQLDTPQVTATDKPEVKDSSYLEEPVMDKEPVTQVDLPTCGIWEMILSWFGIKSNCI